jgi:hypothetical protein
MKDIDIAALFCEVLSGLCALLIGLEILDISQSLPLSAAISKLAPSSVGSLVALVFVAAYVVGIVVDATGMAFDRWVEKSLRRKKWLGYAGKMPPLFYAKAQAHQLAYWKENWTYFSCYRNLLMLCPAWALLAVAITWKYTNAIWTVAMAVLCGLAIASLIVTIRELQRALTNIAQIPP